MTEVKSTSLSKSKEYMKRILENKPSICPFYILKFGPTGSGKGTIMNHVYRNILGIKESDIVNIELDDLVEHLTSYNSEATALLKERGCLSADELKPALQKQLSDLYFRQREQVETLSTTLVADAFMNRNHIAVETTGGSAEGWKSYLPGVQRLGYKIILVYPYVRDDVLQQRVKSRNSKQIRKVSIVDLPKMAQKAQQSFVELVPFVDRAFMVDNNDSDMRIIVDIKDKKPICTLPMTCRVDSSMADDLQTLIRQKCKECFDKDT